MLVNGALINFDPVKELSSFIELSELENIHFEKMENDFFIRNNFLYIPNVNFISFSKRKQVLIMTMNIILKCCYRRS